MKKDGLFADIIRLTVEKQKKKYAEKPPELFTNQKKQMWYFMMNQIDGVRGADTDNAAEEETADPENR